MQLTRAEFAWVISRVVESIPEIPEEGAHTPLEQTFRIPIGQPDGSIEFKYVQVMLLEADQAIFERNES
jgi:hypothetical protein